MTTESRVGNIGNQILDGKSNMVPCETWDNATLVCDVVQPETETVVPMSLKTCRIAPGEAGCVTPEETALSHRLFTAELMANDADKVVPVIMQGHGLNRSG